MIMINGIITIGPMVVVGKVLRSAAKVGMKKAATTEQSTGKNKKKKKKDAVRKAQQKLMNFALSVGLLEFLAAMLRVKDSVSVPPLKEGKQSITEWIPVFASFAASVPPPPSPTSSGYTYHAACACPLSLTSVARHPPQGYLLFGFTKAPWGPFILPCTSAAQLYRKEKAEGQHSTITSASSGGSSGGDA